MEMFSVDWFKAMAQAYVVPFAIRALVATVVFIVGRLAARLVVGLARRVMQRAKLDESLTKFLCDLTNAVLLMVVIIASLQQLGVETTAAVAVLGAAGLAIGLALQGSLGNFASGVMLIGFRPYKVGDLVRIAGETGVVHAIRVFNTELLTVDNRKIIVPNGQVTGGVIENMTDQPTRRVDLVFGIGYGDDLAKAKRVMLEVMTAHPKVLAEPAPVVAVSALGDSSVDLVVRPWCKTEDYWEVNFAMHEQIKLALDANHISIPFPQRDVHLIGGKAAA